MTKSEAALSFHEYEYETECQFKHISLLDALKKLNIAQNYIVECSHSGSAFFIFQTAEYIFLFLQHSKKSLFRSDWFCVLQFLNAQLIKAAWSTTCDELLPL